MKTVFRRLFNFPFIVLKKWREWGMSEFVIYGLLWHIMKTQKLAPNEKNTKI